MRIYSKFHDYYDIGLQHGVDPNCKYIRNTKTLYMDDKQALDIANTIERYSGKILPAPKEAESTHLILFCGNIYFCLDFYESFTEKHTHELSYRHTCFYTYEALEKFVKDRNNKELEKLLTRKVYRFTDGRKLKDVFNEFPKSRNEELVQTQIDLGVPIIKYSYGHWRESKFVELNPSLQDIQFYKVMNPVMAFQELSMFISGVMGGTAPPMVQISDEIRLEKHGFDKITSFRKAKK